MKSTYSVTKAQSRLSRLIKDAAKEGPVAITCREETVAYLISSRRMEAISETLDILANPKAMQAIREYEQGKMKFLPLESLNDED